MFSDWTTMQEGFTTDGVIRRGGHKNTLSRALEKFFRKQSNTGCDGRLILQTGLGRDDTMCHEGRSVKKGDHRPTCGKSKPKLDFALTSLFKARRRNLFLRLFVRGVIAFLSARGTIRHVRAIARQSHVVFARVKYFPITLQNTIRSVLVR